MTLSLRLQSTWRRTQSAASTTVTWHWDRTERSSAHRRLKHFASSWSTALGDIQWPFASVKSTSTLEVSRVVVVECSAHITSRRRTPFFVAVQVPVFVAMGCAMHAYNDDRSLPVTPYKIWV